MTEILEHSTQEWANDPSLSQHETELRQAIHIILIAISENHDLRMNMVLKGGILLAIRYQTQRYTKDIDFSTDKNISEISPKEILSNLNSSLSYAVESSGYSLDCKIQSWEVQPKNNPNPTFPNIKLKVGYAYKGTPKHKRLLAGCSPSTVAIDFSLNEVTPNIESFQLGDEKELLVYSLIDLIAEKLRSYLQQTERNRFRRQDIYDLHLIIEHVDTFDIEEKRNILDSLKAKAHSREIYPNIDSFSDSELRQRAKQDYQSLDNEIDRELPDFDIGYGKVESFYKSLPWG